MATLSKGKVFTNGELVTPATLHSLVDSGTVTNIVNADISNTAAIADTKLAQITTAGKVANTATTATSANTGNSIVARDAGGSFTAGTITAALSGNAATATTLQTARTINGVSFNGGGNITVTAAPDYHTHDASAITTGTLANARTTATTAATASTIVLRDSNANANLGGNMVGKGNTNEGTNTVLGGGSPLQALTSGANNIAIGHNAQNKTTTGSRNVAVGQESLFNNTTGERNIAVGTLALNANTIGFYNTAVGDSSLAANATSSYNTAVGNFALNNHTTNGLNTAIGYQASNFTTNGANTTCLGANTSVTASNQVQLGDSATTVFAYGAVQNRSDVRDKTDIRDTALGLKFIQALRPVDFRWDYREDYRPFAPTFPAQDASDEEKAAYKAALNKWQEDVKLANITHDGSKKRNRYHHGLIAQEVKAVLDAQGLDFGGYQDHSIKGGDDVLSIGYEELIAPMLKAIQELAAEVAALKAGK
jgi:hypothetical protein